MQFRTLIALLAATSVLSACQTDTSEDPAPEVPETEREASPEPEPTATVSILRPEVEQPPEPEPALEPLNVTIGFPQGGADLDDAAIASLEEALASDQMAQGGPIILGAHSDSAGSDQANERAAEARGLAVAQWLVENSVEPDRIDVIVFGEQNPIEPNALPDGSPNEAGRAANRRVDIRVDLPEAAAEEASGESGN